MQGQGSGGSDIDHATTNSVWRVCTRPLNLKNGEVFKYIIDQLSPLYHIHYEVVKFAHFGHRSNRRRLLMAMMLKSIFDSPNFSDFPTGQIENLSDAGPVSDCLIPTTDVPESFYVSTPYTPLPANNSNPTGRLVYTHTMDGIHGAGSPQCPAAVFDSRGLAPTGLATVFDNEEEFGVNSGLVFRTNSDGSKSTRPSRLTVQEIVNIGNFPSDTVEVAKAAGLTDGQISSGINNAVPPSVSFPIAKWFKTKLDSVLTTRALQQPRSLLHCGIGSVQAWLTSEARDITASKQGGHNFDDEQRAPSPLMTILPDGPTVVGKVAQYLQIHVSDIDIPASVFIDIITEVLQVETHQPVITAGNAIADHVENSNMYCEAEGARLLQFNMMVVLSKQECQLLHTAINKAICRLCDMRLRQLKSHLNCACNWSGEARVSPELRLNSLHDSEGTERSSDEDIDGVPEDHVTFLYRVSNGALGWHSEANHSRTTGSKPEDYIYGDYVVLGEEVDTNLLAEHNATDLFLSDLSDRSTDLSSDDLSDDEAESLMELRKVRRLMHAAARREDFGLASRLQTRALQLRRGLTKLAQKKGATDTQSQRCHVRSKQQPIRFNNVRADVANNNPKSCHVSSHKSAESPTTDTVVRSKTSTAKTLHQCLALALWSLTTQQIGILHHLLQWRINMHFTWIKHSIAKLAIENARFKHMSHSQSPATPKLPIKLPAYPTSLREAAITVIEENSLSPGRVATLSTDLKVELAYELSLISDSPLSARFRVEHWLLNPLEAEAAGNDWRVEEDCDLLTSQIIDAWSSLPNGASINYCSMSDYQHQRNSQRNSYLRALDRSEAAIYGAPSELEHLNPTVVELATPPRSTEQQSPLLTYILGHTDLAPTLLGCLQQWPTLLSHSTLRHCDNLHSICSTMQLAHKSWTSELRSSRLLLWLHLSPPAARVELTPLIIDDCRISMITMTVQTARQLTNNYASICKLAASAIKASLNDSPDRSRIIQMCKVGDRLSPTLLNKLLNIRATGLLLTWSRATVAHATTLHHGLQLLDSVTKCTASITAREVKRHITNWLTQMYDSHNSTATNSRSETGCNSSATANNRDYAKPSITYLAEERQALRTFFRNQIGEPHIHMYLVADGISNLPRGKFNPCDKKYRKPDFPLRIPIKQKVGPDVAIGQLSKLLPDRPELAHIQICSRSSMAAQLARSIIKSATIQPQSVNKQGGWDDMPPSSILFNPIHPTIKKKRAKLEGKPTPEELAAEKEFEAACLSASLGGASEKRYTYYVQQFNEYLNRCETTLLMESDAAADNVATLKDLRFWIRRFLLSEGGVRGLQYSSISGKAYAIRWHFLTTYGVDPLDGWVEHKLFMKGLKRVRHSPKRKIPVSWALLMYITRQLEAEGSWRSRTILVAILVGWWFLCRTSELIAFRIGSVRFYDASGSQLNINSDCLKSAVEADLIFGVTKNDVEGDGAIRTHSKVDSVLCVVSALASLVTYRRQCAANNSMSLDPMSPLFKFVDDSQDSTTEKQLGRSTMTRVLKAAASSAGIPDSKVSCHSLRSGGAVQMMSVSGCSYSDVRLFGRWRSDAARIYLRAVRGMMREISTRMAANSTDCSVLLTGGAREKRY